MEIGKEKEKEKEISLLPPPAGPIQAQVPPPLPPSRASRTAHAAHLSRPPAPHSPPLADDLTPHISRARSRSLATALPLASGPSLSATLPSPVIRLSARSPSATARPVASPLSRSPARFGALHLPEPSRRPVCPSHPVATTVRHHPRRGKLAGARHLSPPFPAPGANKRTARAPSFSTPASATPFPLPRAQLSQRRLALPPLW